MIATNRRHLHLRSGPPPARRRRTYPRSNRFFVFQGIHGLHTWVGPDVLVQDISCSGYRNLTLETSSPSSQSSAVASPGPAKCCAFHLSPLPCSDLGQGVAISTTAFMLPRFFVQTPIFSVSSIVHLHLSIDECSPDAPRIRVAHDPRAPPTAVRMLC